MINIFFPKFYETKNFSAAMKEFGLSMSEQYAASITVGVFPLPMGAFPRFWNPDDAAWLENKLEEKLSPWSQNIFKSSYKQFKVQFENEFQFKILDIKTFEEGLNRWVKQEGGQAKKAAQLIKEAFIDDKETLILTNLKLKTLPSEIGLLVNLKELYLNGNCISSLNEVEPLFYLWHLVLWDNPNLKEIPASFEEFPYLDIFAAGNKYLRLETRENVSFDVLYEGEIKGPKRGQKKAVRIIKTSFPFLLRQERIIHENSGKFIRECEMVADRILVSLPEGMDRELFIHNLSEPDIKLELVPRTDTLYRLKFDSVFDSIDRFDNVIKKIKLMMPQVRAQPDYARGPSIPWRFNKNPNQKKIAQISAPKKTHGPLISFENCLEKKNNTLCESEEKDIKRVDPDLKTLTEINPFNENKVLECPIERETEGPQPGLKTLVRAESDHIESTIPSPMNNHEEALSLLKEKYPKLQNETLNVLLKKRIDNANFEEMNYLNECALSLPEQELLICQTQEQARNGVKNCSIKIGLLTTTLEPTFLRRFPIATQRSQKERLLKYARRDQAACELFLKSKAHL